MTPCLVPITMMVGTLPAAVAVMDVSTRAYASGQVRLYCMNTPNRMSVGGDADESGQEHNQDHENNQSMGNQENSSQSKRKRQSHSEYWELREIMPALMH